MSKVIVNPPFLTKSAKKEKSSYWPAVIHQTPRWPVRHQRIMIFMWISRVYDACIWAGFHYSNTCHSALLTKFENRSEGCDNKSSVCLVAQAALHATHKWCMVQYAPFSDSLKLLFIVYIWYLIIICYYHLWSSSPSIAHHSGLHELIHLDSLCGFINYF